MTDLIFSFDLVDNQFGVTYISSAQNVIKSEENRESAFSISSFKQRMLENNTAPKSRLQLKLIRHICQSWGWINSINCKEKVKDSSHKKIWDVTIEFSVKNQTFWTLNHAACPLINKELIQTSHPCESLQSLSSETPESTLNDAKKLKAQSQPWWFRSQCTLPRKAWFHGMLLITGSSNGNHSLVVCFWEKQPCCL